MTHYILIAIFILIALLSVVMRKTYYYLPFKELKRQAAQDNIIAKRLYRAVAYGESLDLLLWFLIIIPGSIGIVLLAKNIPIYSSISVIVIFLWISYALLPNSRLTYVGSRLTMIFTPFLAWILDRFHPVISRLSKQVQKRYNAPIHTGLYERADLLDVIESQFYQEDSRFTNEELMIAGHALSFNDYSVHDILDPWSKVKTVSTEDIIGPVLIDEFHRTNQPLIPVLDGIPSSGRIVGTLQVHQLGLQSNGRAIDLMDQKIYYLHEDDTLTEALHAFYVTNQPQFIVLDSNGGYVGIITLATMLKQLVGDLEGDNSDYYLERSEIIERHQPKKYQEDLLIETDNTEASLDNQFPADISG